jgi:hypothetical protein
MDSAVGTASTAAVSGQVQRAGGRPGIEYVVIGQVGWQCGYWYKAGVARSGEPEPPSPGDQGFGLTTEASQPKHSDAEQPSDANQAGSELSSIRFEQAGLDSTTSPEPSQNHGNQSSSRSPSCGISESHPEEYCSHKPGYHKGYSTIRPGDLCARVGMVTCQSIIRRSKARLYIGVKISHLQSARTYHRPFLAFYVSLSQAFF